MIFLVRISVSLPADLESVRREELLAAERRRGVELKDAGTVVDIWRIPGRSANVGIWSAADATELHEALLSLPVFAYADIDVTPLARHHLTTEGR
jgi:muconolactone D-isomerase